MNDGLRKNITPHWSLHGITDYLTKLPYPEGLFNPVDIWEHTYDIWPGSIWQVGNVPPGTLKIKREFSNEDNVTILEVKSESPLFHGEKQCVSATINCASDRFCTLKSWKIESVIFNAKNEKVADFATEESGEAMDGLVKLTSVHGKEKQFKLSPLLTSNWSIIDALQRFPLADVPSEEFGMFEDLRLYRAKQTLTAEGSTSINLGGKKTQLFGFRQIGEGILPIDYWLDNQHRLLLAIGNVRIYTWRQIANI